MASALENVEPCLVDPHPDPALDSYIRRKIGEIHCSCSSSRRRLDTPPGGKRKAWGVMADAPFWRGGDRVETYRFARVIDCTGLSGHPDSSQNPLIRALLARGTARSDPLGIGLDISEDYALVERSSKRSRRVLALGPLTRAAFWECTAIPDIRVQCGHVA
jgi:hypothetical protein